MNHKLTFILEGIEELELKTELEKVKAAADKRIVKIEAIAVVKHFQRLKEQGIEPKMDVIQD